MPRISTDNYDTVASWNGSQDLFIVEQPDGTKVATPAMVKQFIEAGDFEAAGEIKDGHGNILKDMAKSADVDAEIGDLSQTGLTGDSVAAQLETVGNQIEEKSGVITLNSGWAFDQGVVNNVKKVGNIAWISSYIYSTVALTRDTTYEIGTLPEGFRPEKEYKCPLYQGAGTGALRGILNIRTTGKIEYRSVDSNVYALTTTVMYPLS